MRKLAILPIVALSLGLSAMGAYAADTASAKTPSAPAASVTATTGSAPTASAPAAKMPSASAAAAAPAAGALPAASNGVFTDAQLESYLGVQRELMVLNSSGVQLSSPTPEVQAQIAAILQRYNLDGATYNQISASAKSDKKLQSRLAALKTDSTVKTQ